MFNSSEEVFLNIKEEHFKKLLDIVSQFKNIDKENLLKNYKEHNPNLKNLQDRWLKSIENDNSTPDYSVYAEDDYLNEAFYCWKTYSRKYLLMIKKYIDKNNCEIDINNIKNILDLGCGLGYTTLGLYNIFDKSKIIGTNVKNSTQYLVNQIISKKFNDRIRIIDEKETLNLQNIDLIFASEFFEHLDNPIDLLNNLIIKYKPKYFIIANTFTQLAIGHFRKYYYNSNIYNGKNISKLFNNILRNNNYKKINTGFWNNRPTIWKLEEIVKLSPS